jgi:hypothetical protein
MLQFDKNNSFLMLFEQSVILDSSCMLRNFFLCMLIWLQLNYICTHLLHTRSSTTLAGIVGRCS